MQGNGRCQLVYPHTLPLHPEAHHAHHALPGTIDAGLHIGQPRHQKGCRGRGSLHPRVGHHVEHALVALVSDARDHGQGEVGHILGQCQGVETGKVAGGPAATDDDHHVKLLGPCVDGIECGDDALFHLLALHGGGEKFSVETEAVVVGGQLVGEVAIAGSRRARHHGHALREEREPEFLLQVEHALGPQPGNDFLPAAGHVAHRVGGVNVVDYP